MVDVLSSHDEPFVIDNFPLDIDLGERHKVKTVKGSGKNWIRKETILDSILVLEKSLGGARDFQTNKLDLKKPIHVLLENGKALSLTFNVDGLNSSLIISPSVELKKEGRRMKQKEGEDRIVLISWHPDGEDEPVEHRPILQPLSSVYVVLFKSGHSHKPNSQAGRKPTRKQSRR